MTIETKYDIGQSVFFMYENKVHSAEIISISIEVFPLNTAYGTSKTQIRYELSFKGNYGGNKIIEEELLFATKKDLLESL